MNLYHPVRPCLCAVEMEKITYFKWLQVTTFGHQHSSFSKLGLQEICLLNLIHINRDSISVKVQTLYISVLLQFLSSHCVTVS